MRNEPSQKRSSNKVDEILKAAEELLVELPIEEITTTIIAERAGVTRTSMYHFFPSKLDVFDALTEKYHATLRQKLLNFFDPRTNEEYHQAWAGVAGVYKDFFEKTPSAAILLLGRKGAKQAIFGNDESEERLAEDISNLMARHTNFTEIAKRNPPEPDFFQFVLRIMTSLFSAGVRKDGRISERTEEEARRATIAYIDARVNSDSS
ncbi:TetR/AcrR family transcriptional regulator [Hyphococcus sp. DH-69]|uniref:TetR/AcrR family transcriptional regulator n=1 Tax=Hyphococcus formosus TaxID=3143534 RepID=UPI00398AE014